MRKADIGLASGEVPVVLEGQIMFRGGYIRDKRVGLHEYWYPCGGKMEQIEDTRSGVSVSRWLGDGSVLERYTEKW